MTVRRRSERGVVFALIPLPVFAIALALATWWGLNERGPGETRLVCVDDADGAGRHVYLLPDNTLREQIEREREEEARLK